MPTKPITSSVVASLLLMFPALMQAGESEALWEVNLRSQVEWPAIPAPRIEDENAKQTDAPVMVTERTLQASLTGHLLAITDGRIQFEPILGRGKARDSLSADRVQSLRRIRRPDDSDVPKPSPAEIQVDSGERLVTFRSGSCVPGRLLRISTAGLVLAFGESDELTVPLQEILSINPLQSDGKRLEPLPSADGRHVARLTTGEIITGNIAPVTSDRDRLTISSPILSGEFPLKLIESMLFPIDREYGVDSAAANTAAPKGREFLINFSAGASLTSPTIQLKDGTLELEIWKGTPFHTAITSVESITFIDPSGTRPNGPIFVWGQHSDQNDEFQKLQDCLKGANLSRELIIMDGAKGTGEDFSAALERSSAFVWAEWEKMDSAAFESSITGAPHQPLGEQLQSYIQNGGIAVFVGLSSSTVDQFARLGLGRIESSGSIGDGSPLELTGIGEMLAPFTAGDVKAANSTMMYKVAEGGAWTPLLTKPGSRETAAIVGRRIGSGWIFLMGMDFYETNDNVTRILTELLRFRQ
ncbi:MAG: hypothetical protein R3F19_24535 [Verrucomicrobiales bacterium]